MRRIFVSVTAVPNVYIKYGTPDQAALHSVTIKELESYKEYSQFKAGSMLPKVEAAIKFAKKGGVGIITDIEHLSEALQGKAGTIIRK